ncbi:MAG: phosphoenolpyruvate synthase [Candidatus Babeliales bacterium]
MYIRFFKDIRNTDVPLVGGKTASLGEMYGTLSSVGIAVPNGFAVTADAYREVLKENKLEKPITDLLAQLSTSSSFNALQLVGKKIRDLILAASLPAPLIAEITAAYQRLSQEYQTTTLSVAVRSSATAEDLPSASFAGQQESYLNVVGVDALLDAYKKCVASLFTDRAMVYRQEHAIAHMSVALSVAVQKMVRSDLGASGVLFTLDPDTGFRDVVVITAAWGLAEAVVQGTVMPDEWWVHKPLLKKGYAAIVKKRCGSKEKKTVFAAQAGIAFVDTTAQERSSFALTDQLVCQLAQLALHIEEHYSRLANHLVPMDIEWAYDGQEKKLYIVQARPETVHAREQGQIQAVRYSYGDKRPQESDVIARGIAVGVGIATGTARIIETLDNAATFNAGDVLVTRNTNPDWTALMKKAAAIITDNGGRTSHAAIVARELGIPALIGTVNATQQPIDGKAVTVDCSTSSHGIAYAGTFKIQKQTISLAGKKVPLNCDAQLIIGDPDQAFVYAPLPVTGVGLARLEFIIANSIGVHPLVALHPEKITDPSVKQTIAQRARGFADIRTFFIETVAAGIAAIAAAFYPRRILMRFSDFKSNEYRALLGGSFFEPTEENPMLGLRGASRYYSDLYKNAFALECEAVLRAREVLGFDTIDCMIPFVRTPQEAQLVVELLQQNNIARIPQKLALYMMCEIPSNVLCIDQFAPLFDGISIGSNDLTQLTLGIDRDNSALSSLFSEQNDAVKMLITQAIKGAHAHGLHVGLCGQAPSDDIAFAQFLVTQGIDAISFNPDAILTLLQS